MLTRKLTWLLFMTLACAYPTAAQGLVVNEFSNGASGSKEFVELVVIGTIPSTAPCAPVDIRNWIIDDNNGDFSCGACSNRGIATGHMRFGNSPTWAAVPQGSIIVVYNAGDVFAGMPANDPNDTAPADGVYIVPSNHASMEATTTPCGINSPSAGGNCGACSGIATYAGVCYTAGVAAGWDNLNLRNTGDAMQTRRPDGSYFHGLANDVGTLGMSGGVDGLLVTSTLTNAGIAFTNVMFDGNFRSITNFAVVPSASGTPGAANSANNAAWISQIGACILPVRYAAPLQVQSLAQENLLSWVTAREVNCRHFEVQRAASPEGEFTAIGVVPGAGNSDDQLPYEFRDKAPLPNNYYRIVQIDLDGNATPSGVVEVTRQVEQAPAVSIWPQPASAEVNYDIQGIDLLDIQLIDAMGRVVFRRDLEPSATVAAGAISMQALSEGVYFLQVRSARSVLREKIVHIR